MMFLEFQKYQPINPRFPRRTTVNALIDKSSAKVVLDFKTTVPITRHTYQVK